PALSHHRNYKALGSPLNREAALENPLRDDFFGVADFIVENNPAVMSYLDTGAGDVVRWQESQDRQPESIPVIGVHRRSHSQPRLKARYSARTGTSGRTSEAGCERNGDVSTVTQRVLSY